MDDIVKLEEGSHWFKVTGVINIYFKDGVPHLYVHSGVCQAIDYMAPGSENDLLRKATGIFIDKEQR